MTSPVAASITLRNILGQLPIGTLSDRGDEAPAMLTPDGSRHPSWVRSGSGKDDTH